MITKTSAIAAVALILGSVSVASAATHKVVQHLRRWIIAPGQTHPWVALRLRLNDHPVVRRDLD